VLRWDAATGTPIGDPLHRTPGDIRELAAVELPGGRQLLIGIGRDSLHRWDPVTGAPFGPAAGTGGERVIMATWVDPRGIPVVFLLRPEGHDDQDPAERVELWRLDTATRVDVELPGTLRAVFDDDDGPRMVLSEHDGSLAILPLPPAAARPDY
jgi:hypothetical protein